MVVFSWGFNAPTAIANGLRFKVQGFKFKGTVEVEYNEGTDLFEVKLIKNGKVVETVDTPQNVGAMGATVLVAVGLGICDSIEAAKKLIPVSKSFKPNMENKKVYDKYYAVYNYKRYEYTKALVKCR